MNLHAKVVTSAVEEEFIKSVQQSPLYCNVDFLEAWNDLSPGITPLAISMGITFGNMPYALDDGDLYNALLLNVILGVADGAPVDGYQCPLEFITQGNTISPVHHHLALMARRRWPCITFMSRGTLSNPTERGRYHLVCPGDNVYCLGQCSGPRALRVWYYAFLGMTRKPGCVVVVPPELCRLVQFLCHTFTSRDICPLTGLNVRTDTVLASVSCNLYRAAADAQVVAKRLDF